MQLPGGNSFVSFSVRQLDSCAHGGDQTGLPLGNNQYLTPTEYAGIVALDPYYGQGQGFDPAPSGRGLKVGGISYGTDPTCPCSAPFSPTISDNISTQTVTSTNASASYQSTVTSSVGFSWSAGMTLGYTASEYGLKAGLSVGQTVQAGYQSTTGTQMKITYSASTATTDATATTVSGTFSDDHDFAFPGCPPNCYQPYVNVYMDDYFGSYMFTDPNAVSVLGKINPTPVYLPPKCDIQSREATEQKKHSPRISYTVCR